MTGHKLRSGVNWKVTLNPGGIKQADAVHCVGITLNFLTFSLVVYEVPSGFKTVII